MKIKLPRFSFRNKLLLLFVLLTLLPLFLVAVIVTRTVQQSYQASLRDGFIREVLLIEQNLQYFYQSNLTWIRILSTQDILISEIDKFIQDKDAMENKDIPVTVFTSLVSVKRGNPFIEKVYILDGSGKVLVSTVTNELGMSFADEPYFKHTIKQRSPYFGKMIESTLGKRVIPIAGPLVKKSDNSTLGILVVELNYSIINALFEGTLFLKSDLEPIFTHGSEAYLVNSSNIPLTNLEYGNPELISTEPVKSCQISGQDREGTWINYSGIEVFGVSRCVEIDDFTWTLLIEQPIDEAFSVSNRLGWTIFALTVMVGMIIVFFIFKISESITKPINQLRRGTQEFGKGNLDYRIHLQTHDEIEELSNSFNEMASNLNASSMDLEDRIRLLEIQKKQLDDSTRLLKSQDEELKKDKENLATERDKLLLILSGIHDAVIAVDKEKKVVLFNPAAEKLTGFAQSDVLNKPIYELIKIFDVDKEITSDEYAPINKENDEIIVFDRKNLRLIGKGTEAYINILTGRIKEGSSVELGCILTIHDITEEKKLEEMKLDFVSMAAHELRTPITAVRGYISMLVDEEHSKLDEQSKNYLQKASFSAEELSTLIDNLLSIAKLEGKRVQLNIMPTDWLKLLKNTAEEFKFIAEHKKLTLKLEAPESIPMVAADPLQIREVLNNLLYNAVNYSQKGEITIKADIDMENKTVSTSVIDSGEGIPSESLPYLFQKFYRVTGTLLAGSKGTGLGLYISKKIVELHNGTISVESELGKGSKFTFVLPLVKNE